VTRVEWWGRVWSTLLTAVWWIEPQNQRVTVSRVWPQNPGRGGRLVTASRSSRRALWPSDEDYLRLDHNALGLSDSTQNIERHVWDCVIAMLNKDEGAPISLTSYYFYFHLLRFFSL
jgi:hypothetical protein